MGLIKSIYESFVPEQMRFDRIIGFKSLCQPFRDGVPSLEFQEFYPDKAKKLFFGMEKPKYVWKDLPGWATRHKSM